MSAPIAEFIIIGEVCAMQTANQDGPRLLIDISALPPGGDAMNEGFVPRSTFTVLDPDLIDWFRTSVGIGDRVEARGRFWQADYVPHRTVVLDTTFLIASCEILDKRAGKVLPFNPLTDLMPNRILN